MITDITALDDQLVGWKGQIRIIIDNPDGQIEETIDNLITDVALNEYAKALRGEATDLEIKYIALGDNNTAPANGNTKLGNERFRKILTKQEAGGTGATISTTYVAPFEANFQIQEVGVFAGPAASETKDSGLLVARVLYSHLKTELESITIQRTDTFGRV